MTARTWRAVNLQGPLPISESILASLQPVKKLLPSFTCCIGSYLGFFISIRDPGSPKLVDHL